jgi:hypothetical protein
MVRALMASLVAFGIVPVADGQDSSAKRREAREALEKKFEETLTGAAMEGFFTIDGRTDDKPPAKDVYKIESVKKSGGDVWVVTAYVGYSKATIPVPVEVRWAGDTAVIMLTDVGLPGMKGKFSTRLLIDGDRYAGTWKHDQWGGHMWGKIRKQTAAEAKPAEPK